MTPAPTLRAVQDIDCLDRAKFRVGLAAPLTHGFLAQFQDADVTLREFSRIVPGGRDMVTVRLDGVFQIEAALGDDTLICSFDGDPDDWPQPALRDVAGRLREAGLGNLHYVRGEEPACGTCGMGAVKRCARWRESEARALQASDTGASASRAT